MKKLNNLIFKLAICLFIISLPNVLMAQCSLNAGNDTTICQNRAFVRTAVVTPAGATIQWYLQGNSTNILSTTSTINTALSTSGVFNYIIKVSSGSCTKSDTVEVTVNPSPRVNAGSNQSTCQEGVLNLTASVAPSSASINWYLLGSTTSLGTTTSYNVPTTTTGTFDYVIKADSASTCSTFDTVRVVINPKPVANFTFIVTCGKRVKFTSTSTTTSGTITNYQWNFGASGNNNTSNQQNPNHNYSNTPTTYQVKLIVTNSFGCKDTIVKQVTTNTSLEASLSGSPAPQLYNGLLYFRKCTPQSISTPYTFFNNSPTAALNTTSTIIWGDATPNTVISNWQLGAPGQITHSYSIGDYFLKLVVSNGTCSDTATYGVYLGSNPGGSISSLGSTKGCTGTTFTFPFSSQCFNNSPGTQYFIYVNDGTDTIVYTQENLPTAFTHTFDSTSCGTTSLGQSNTFAISYLIINPCDITPGNIGGIKISRKAKANFTVSPYDTICVNTTLNFNNTSIGSLEVPSGNSGQCIPGKIIWTISPSTGWSIVSGSLGTDLGFPQDPDSWVSGSDLLSINFTQPGIYSVKIKTGNTQCGADSMIKTICVNPIPTAAFTLSPNTGCSPLRVNATGVTNTPTCGSNTYNWTVSYAPTDGCAPNASDYAFVNGTNSSSQNPQFNFISPGVYTIGLQTFSPKARCSSAVVTQTVTVKSKPIVTLSGIPATLCQNVAITPSASADCYIDAATTYAWTFSNATPLSSSQLNPGSVLFNAPGNQTVALTVTNICGLTNAQQTVNVLPIPIIPNQTATICSGSAFTITPTNNPPTTIVPSGTRYTWTVVDNTNVSGDLNETNPQTSISQTLTNNTNVVQTVVYTVTPKTGTCTGATFTITVTVNPKPTIPAQTLTICSGDVFILTLTNNPPNTILPSGTTYTWTVAANSNVTGQSNQPTSTGIISQTLTNSSNSQQTVVYTITPTSGAAGSCVGSPFNLTVNVDPRPKITNINASVCSGSLLTVSIPANNPSTVILPANTTYTWTYVDNTNVTGESNQPTGQASITQTLVNTTNVPQIVVYTVTPKTGNCSGPIFTVTITVNPKPYIPNQTAGTCSGVAFTVTPTNGNPTAATIVPTGTQYTWSIVDNPNITGESNQGTAQSSISQTLTNISNTDQSVVYTVTPVSGAAGSCSGTPFTLTVTLNSKPVIPAQTATTCSGIPFSVAPQNGVPNASTIVPIGTTYTWTVAPNADVTGESNQATPQNSIGQTLVNTTNANQTVVYTVTPSIGTCAGLPFTVTFTVTPAPFVPNQTATICSGTAFTITPANAPPTTIVPSGTTYTWTVASNTNVTGQSDQTVAQTSISQTLTNNTNVVQTVVYTVTPKSGTCSGAPFTVTVTVNPKPVVPAQTPNICSGDAFTLTLTNNPTTTIIPSGTTYTWTAASNTNVTGQSNQTGVSTISQTLTNSSNSQQAVVYTITPTSGAAGSCAGSPFTLTVNVDPRPKITNINASVCSGSLLTVSIPANNPSTVILPANTTYTWTFVDNANVTGESNQGTGQTSITQTLVNTTNVPQIVVYTVTPTTGSCSGSPFTVTVTVNPKPYIPNQTAGTCSGLAFTVTLTNGNPTAATVVPAGTQYTWTVAPNADVTGEVNQTTAQSSISQTLTNISNTDQSVVYTVTPVSGAAGSCQGTPFTLTVTLNSKPVIPNQIATICSGIAFSVAPQNGVPNASTIVPSGTTYTWTVAPNADVTGESDQSTLQNSIGQTLVNTTNANQTVVYTVTPSIGTCAGLPFTLTFTVTPAPFVPNQTATICSGSAFTITPTNAPSTTIVPSGTTYTWSVASNTNVTGQSDQTVAQPSISQTLTNNTNEVQTVVYTVTPKSGSCSGAPFTVTVTVNPKPVVPAQTPNICSGDAFTLTLTNNPTTTIIPSGTTYTWTAATNANVTGQSNQPTSTGIISQTLTNSSNSQQTVVYTITPTSGAAGSCVGSPFTLTVNVDPRPKITNINASVCSGSLLTVSIPANNPSTVILPANTTYTWTYVDNTNVTGESNQGTGQASITQTLVNTTNVPQIVVYTVTPTTGNCSGPIFTVTITVNPAPYIPSQTAVTCSGIPFTVTLTNGNPTSATVVPAGTQYTWTVASNSDVTGEADQTTAQSSISQTLTNTSNINQSVVYTVTPISGAAGSCAGTPFTLTVTLNTKPVIPAQTPTTCSGIPFSVSPQNGVPNASTIVPNGTTYTWTVAPNANVTGASNQTTPQTTIGQTLVNTTNTDQTVVYTVTPLIGNCAGVTFTVTVTVTPAPFVPNQTATICSGSAFTITPTNTPTTTIVPSGTTYTWTVASNTNVTGQSDQTVGQPSIIQTLTNNTNVVQTVVYNVTPQSGSCTGATFTITVSVNPKPVVPAQTQTICSGNAFTLTLTNDEPTTIIPLGTTYTWTVASNTNVTGQSNQTGVSTISQTLTNSSNSQQAVVYTITPTSGAAGSCAGSPFNLTVNVDPRPKITNINASVCSGSLLTVSIPANNPSTVILPANTTYTWTFADNVNVTGESNQATGQASITQTLVNTTNVPQIVVYTVTPTTGNCSGPIFTVTVTVNPAPYISDITAVTCSGTLFSVTPANGVPTSATVIPANTTYTWTVTDNTNVSGDVNQTSPQSSISQTLTNNTNVLQTIVYTVTPISGAAGSCAGTPFTLTVTLNTKPVIPNQTATTCSGTSFTVPLTNNPPTTILPIGTTYTWTVVDNVNVTGESNQTTPQNSIGQSLVNITNTDQTVVYTVTPLIGNCAGLTFTVTVTVTPAPFVPNQTATICSGSAFTITPTNTPTTTIVPSGTTYTWTVASNTNVTGQADQTVGQNSISQTLTNNTNVEQTVVYNVTPQSGTCTGATFTVTVTVNPKPVLPTQTQTICSENIFTLTLTNDEPTTIIPSGTTYTWTVASNTNVNGQSNQTGVSTISQTLTNLSNTQQPVVYTITPTSGAAGSCVGSPFTLTVNVDPRPKITDITASVCSGSLLTVSIPANNPQTVILPANTTYTWTFADNVNVTGESNQATGQASITQTLVNTTNVPQIVVYTVTPTTGNCSGPIFTVTITVNPAPYIPSQTAVTCSETLFSVTPTHGDPTAATVVPTNTTYTWTVADNLSVSGDVNQTSPQSNISQTLTNNTNVVQTIVYTVTPLSGATGSCAGTPFTLTVTLNTKPLIPNQSVSTCSAIAFTLPLTNNPPTTILPSGTTYTWTVVDNPLVIGDLDQATPVLNLSQTLTNTTNTPQIVQYNVTPGIGNCTGTSFSLSVTINPAPIVPNQTDTICSGEPFTLPLLVNNPPSYIIPNGTTYTWTVVDNPNISGDVAQTTAQNSVSQTLVNNSNIPQSVTYTVTPLYGNCVGNSFSVAVVVNPKPVIPNYNIDFCSGTLFTFNPTNTPPTIIIPNNTTYEWTVSNNTNITGQSSSTSPQSSINQTLTNTSNTPQVITYTITPTSGEQGNCPGQVVTYTITINPAPVFPTMFDTLCSGNTFDSIPQNNPPLFIVPAGTTYTWNVPNMPTGIGPDITSGTSGGVATTSPQNQISGTLTNTAYNPLNVTYSITPSSPNSTGSGCAGVPFNYVVTVNPLPVISNNPLSQTICNETSTSSITFTSFTNNSTYNWNTVGTTTVTGQTVAGSGNLPSMLLSNAGDAQDSVNYAVTTTANACAGPATNYTIYVNPDAKANYTYPYDTACWPYAIVINNTSPLSPGNINIPNSSYNWYTIDNIASETFIGTGSLFPGYSILGPSDSIKIKMVAISAFGCKNDSLTHTFYTKPKPTAAFSMSNRDSCGPLTISFLNQTNIRDTFRYQWNFGNGQTSTATNPSPVTYVSNPRFFDTTYYITLLAFNECDTTIYLDSVIVRADPKARFAVSSSSGCSPFTIQITNSSLGNPHTYYWDFGDGTPILTTTTLGTLSHTYYTGIVDTFELKLVAISACGSDTQKIKIRVAPNVIIPGVSVTATELYGCVSHSVNFNNTSTGATNFIWDFGDGTPLQPTNFFQTIVNHTYNTAGTFNVHINMTNGCSDTSINTSITVYPRPIAAFTASQTVYCFGDTTRFINNSINATNYTWSLGNGVINTNFQPNYIYLNPGVYNVQLEAQQSNTTGLVCYDTITRSITILSKPDTAIITNINPINCSPFIITGSVPGYTTESITWYVYDTTLPVYPIVIANPILNYTFNNSGRFKVVMVIENASGCKDSSFRFLSVYAKPVAAFTPLNLTTCSLDTTVSYINNTTANIYTPLTYRWYVDGIQRATSGNFTYRYTALPSDILPRTFDTKLVATNSVGCADSITGALQISPTAKSIFTLSNPQACIPFVAAINNSSTYASNYQWYLNGVLVSTDENPIININRANTSYTVTLIVSNIYACRPDTSSYTFRTRVMPIAAFSFNDTLGCTGQLAVVTTNTSQHANAYIWQWGDASPNSTLFNPSHLFTSVGNFNTTLTASDGVCTDTVSHAVVVSQKPTANFIANNVKNCDTSGVRFINLTANATSFIWTVSNGFTTTETSPTITLPPSATSYSVTLLAINADGCRDSLTRANYIKVYALPPADFTITPSSTIYIPNYTFGFLNLTPDNPIYRYNWSLGDGTFAITRDVVSHLYDDTGNYEVRLTVLDTTTSCVDTVIKYARILGYPGYLYVPNAFYANSTQLNFKYFKPLGKGLAEYELLIYDSWGKLLFRTTKLDYAGSPVDGWDGTFKGAPMPQDAYAWKIKARFRNGKIWEGMNYDQSQQGQPAHSFGTITLFR